MSQDRDRTPVPGEPTDAGGTRTLTDPGPGSAATPSSGALDGARFAAGTVLATGVLHVLVNGTPVLRDGEPTGATPGQVVRGPGWSGW